MSPTIAPAEAVVPAATAPAAALAPVAAGVGGASGAGTGAEPARHSAAVAPAATAPHPIPHGQALPINPADSLSPARAGSLTSALATAFATALAALERVPRSPAELSTLPDAAVLELASTAAAMQRLVGTHSALIAGEIGRRSARDLGHSGLAQRAGYRTPEELVRVTTGSTAREAFSAVRVGTLALDSSSASPTQPWLTSVSAALVAGALSPAAAEAIRSGLGAPSANVPATALAEAAIALCRHATTLDADRIFRRARELRDELDEAGIADRETARREQRTLRFTRLPDGFAHLSWRLDPESAAVVGDLYDRATSPRRGGPRFVGGGSSALAESILTDKRTTEQLASDTFVELLRHGADSNPARLLGSGAPVVRVVTTRAAVDSRAGHGWIDGHPDPISIETIERLACSGATQPVTVDAAGQPLDVGREQRLFTRRQRDALALRDGGCRWPGCDRPPSWTEAHHTKHWARDHGPTNLDNGVLLCRHHHLLLHNNHWEIERGHSVGATLGAHVGGNVGASVGRNVGDGIDESGASGRIGDAEAELWLVPPPDIDPQQRRRAMPSKSPFVRELTRAGALAHTHADTHAHADARETVPPG